MHDFYGNGEVSFETFDFYSIFSIEMNRIFVPDVPIFLPYITKFTTKITKSMKFSFTQYRDPLPFQVFLSLSETHIRESKKRSNTRQPLTC